MKRPLLLIAVLFSVALVPPGLHAKKVKIQVQYNKQTDFTKFKTYAWSKHDAVARPVLALEVMGAVDDELQHRGLTRVEANSDLMVIFYGGINTDTSIAASDPSYSSTGGIPSVDSNVWSGSSLSRGPSSAVFIQKGTLMIDLVDSQAKGLAWRGIATGNLDTNDTKALEEVDKSIEKMFAEYPVKRGQ